ncbi:endonuclease-reverse transcriptase [Elysia marginata]|uniref:Endonuclease-reverse transcriptase n=1 Tax=Elysia marginata TaxID=1093978 RepID=A0AAV4JII6_9GAST|nr:endonuclease-reverse transcriptase [Elysia marginata]
MNNTLKKKIEAAEMWFIRRILKVSWKDKKTNDEVLDMANTGRSLNSTIRRRHMKFTGHIYRARGIEHLAMTGKINGKKSRGRQRTTYVDSLNTWANLEQHTITRSQFMRSSCERQIWKTMTVNACSRHGT